MLFLRGYHSQLDPPETVRRRLTSRSILTRWRGLNGSFDGPSLKSALRLGVRASGRPRQRKSKKAVTGDVLEKLLDASERLAASYYNNAERKNGRAARLIV